MADADAAAVCASLCPPGDLDDAVLDRMDEALEFGLPHDGERKKMLDLYLDKWVPAGPGVG